MSPDRFFTPAELEVWMPLVAVLELLPHELDAQLVRDSALTHFDYVALSMLTRAPEHRLQMKQLAASTSATMPRLSHVVSRLERRGLVVREAHAADGRGVDVVITPEGRRVVLQATPGHVEAVRRLVLEGLDADQRAHLAEIAGVILTRLDPDARRAIGRLAPQRTARPGAGGAGGAGSGVTGDGAPTE